jgi:hypothetical protein
LADLYAATNDASNDVLYCLPGGTDCSTFTSLPFTSSLNQSGMAVDNVHHRLYISNTSGNQIAVYSTKPGTTYGTLIHTIQN